MQGAEGRILATEPSARVRFPMVDCELSDIQSCRVPLRGRVLPVMGDTPIMVCDALPGGVGCVQHLLSHHYNSLSWALAPPL